jgi:drug/metabolite transporter (DMT)-like permease
MAAASTDAPAARVTGASWLLPLLLTMDGLHFVFANLARKSGLDPRLSTTLIMGIAALIVGSYGLATRQLNLAELRRNTPFLALIGLLVAISTQIGYFAVGYVDPGAAALLSQMVTVWSIVFGVLWLRERFRRAQGAGALLALCGAAIIALQPGDYFRIGSLMLVFSTFSYALHAAVVKRKGGGMNFVNFFFGRLLFTTLWLFLAGSVQGALYVPDLRSLGVVTLIGIVDVVISRSLYYLLLRRINVSALAVTLTLSPVVAAVWSFLIDGTQPSLQQLIGGAVVLLGVFVVVRNR